MQGMVNFIFCRNYDGKRPKTTFFTQKCNFSAVKPNFKNPTHDPLRITPSWRSVKRNQNLIKFRCQNLAYARACLFLKLSSFISWFSLLETWIKLSPTLQWRQLHSHSYDYGLYMLKCPAHKIFKATTGGKKCGHRPPVVALRVNKQIIMKPKMVKSF